MMKERIEGVIVDLGLRQEKNSRYQNRLAEKGDTELNIGELLCSHLSAERGEKAGPGEQSVPTNVHL